MKLIKKIYNYKPIKKHLSKIIFTLKNRPTIDSKAKNKLKNALFLISADFELAWAFRYSKSGSDPIKKAQLARKNFPIFLELFEKYKIPITWATVGHLFLESCKKGDHDWMARIPYFENRNWIYKNGDWFDSDTYSNWRSDNSWYAPDLIKSILKSSVKHEIASHSFSHIDFTYKNCPKKVAEDELKACKDIANKWGIKLKSFVFPGGFYGNYETLKKYGFKTYRKTIKYELSIPFYDNSGLLVIPVSTGLGDNGLGWSKEYFFKRLQKYIDRAIETKTVCHFWFHPSIDEWFFHNVFPKILEYVNKKRKEKKIIVTTMGDIEKYIN